MSEQNDDRKIRPEEVGKAIGEMFRGLGAMMDAEDAATLARAGESRLLDGAREVLKQTDAEAFYFALTYPIDRVVSALLKEAFPDSHELRFIFAEHDYLHWHLRNIFQEYEGSACCADKAGCVVRRLVRHFLHGKRIEFDRAAQYTYMFPSKVLTTHEEILDAFQALYRMRHGDLRPVAALVAGLERSRANPREPEQA